MKITHKNVFAFLAFSFVVLLGGYFSNFYISPVKAEVATNKYLTGYAWSENIGWISFATSTPNPNGVSIDSSGNISGYAWSDNIGWIEFGGLSDFVGNGNNANFNTSNITGWIRACAGAISGNCSTMNSRTDGWDGWISLFGNGYGISKSSSTNNLSGYAWGSDVLGWIDFSGVSISDVNTNGVCGSSGDAGKRFSSPPTDNLCRITGQTPSVYTSTDYRSYTWNCEGSQFLCSTTRICPDSSNSKISDIPEDRGACVPSNCSGGTGCSAGYTCDSSSKCVPNVVNTGCNLDGVALQENATGTFYKKNIAQQCDSATVICLNGTTTPQGYRFKKCISPRFIEF